MPARGGWVIEGGTEMATLNVASATALAQAISAAKGGDVIVLAPGNYGDVKVASRLYSGPVTIMSADSANVAHFDRLLVNGSSNIVFKQLDISGVPRSTDTSSYLADVLNSSNITFDTVHFHGSLDNNPTGDKSGLSIRSSNSVRIINSEFEQLFRGAWFQRSNNVDIVGNSIHDMRSEGFDFSAVTHVLIDGNKFTNFHRALEDHSDAIQFWTTNETTPSTDIIIRNNQITQGTGTAMQGVFMRDESGILPYERVLIENNLVYESGYANGITVIGGKSITMNNNSVFSVAGDAYTTKIRLENIAGASITGNVTDQFAQLGINSGIVFGNNVLLGSSLSYLSLISDIYKGSAATIEGLLLSGFGYQAPITTTTDPVVVTTIPTTTTTDPVVTATPTTTTTDPIVTVTPTTATTSPTTTTAPTDPIVTAPTTTTTTTTTSPTTTTTKLSGWGRGGFKKTAAATEKVAVTSVDTVTTAVPTSFSVEGLYTGSFSYSGTTSTKTKSAPLTAAAANTRLGGSGFRSTFQLFHA